MANIQEIARLAGVSTATVSRVINNHPYVKRDEAQESAGDHRAVGLRPQLQRDFFEKRNDPDYRHDCWNLYFAVLFVHSGF